MQGLQEVLEFEKGTRKLRIDKIKIIPVEEMSTQEIKNIRIKLQMSQPAFASIIGVSKKTVEAWETGTNKPSGASARMLQLIKKRPDVTEVFYTCKATVRTDKSMSRH